MSKERRAKRKHDERDHVDKTDASEMVSPTEKALLFRGENIKAIVNRNA